ncbi:MAG TPA: hypothetical protein VGQ96_02665, partial [Candidatus Eremiobacteraceae bacterium]|nr:hypothetical protein [Candidatus Eremiobacteraceae bacterium]
SFIEDDVAHLGELHVTARHAALAPITNYFVSSPAFIVEDGAADVALHADATAWPQGAHPTWSITARGMFYDTRLHVSPLIVPMRSLNGPFSLNHGVLRLPRVTGVVGGLPLAAHGAISMQPSLWLDLKVGTEGPLHLARKLLAMLKPMLLEGNVAIAARILGEPHSPHVGVAFAMPHGWLFAKMPVGATTGMLVYTHGHVTLPFAMARYAGFSVQFNGDSNVGPSALPPI